MADWHDNEIGSLMDECAVVPARVRHHASRVPIGGTPGAHTVHVPDGAVCCVRDGGAGHASGSCEHALLAHAYNWDNSVNPVRTRCSIRLHDVWSPTPQIDREKNALEQEVIGPLITSAPLQRHAAPRWRRMSGRRTGANAKTLCAAAT